MIISCSHHRLKTWGMYVPSRFFSWDFRMQLFSLISNAQVFVVYCDTQNITNSLSPVPRKHPRESVQAWTGNIASYIDYSQVKLLRNRLFCQIFFRSVLCFLSWDLLAVPCWWQCSMPHCIFSRFSPCLMILAHFGKLYKSNLCTQSMYHGAPASLLIQDFWLQRRMIQVRFPCKEQADS